MGFTHNRHWYTVPGPWVMMVCYFALASLSLYATQGDNGTATMWPASGLLLAAMLLSPERDRATYLCAAAMASFLANMTAEVPAFMSAIFTFANMCEAILATWILRSIDGQKLSFIDPRNVLKFCIAALAASVLSASLATVLTLGDWNFFISWLTTVALGMLIVTPIIIVSARLFVSSQRKKIRRKDIAEAFLLLGATVAITTGVFVQSSYPLLFLPMVAVLWVTYRLGPFGAASSVCIIAVLTSIFTQYGMGVVPFVEGGQQVTILFLQFYLLVLLISAMPLAALLTTRKRLTRQLENNIALLEQAEAAAHVGHWRLNVVKNQLHWSREIIRIHGLPENHVPTLENSILAYHPDDRKRIEKLLGKTMAKGGNFEFTARIICPGNEIRHIFSRGTASQDAFGKVTALFGMLQDITQQTVDAQRLKVAQERAEKAAEKARTLANTDSLTGLPNRRRIMEIMHSAAEKCHSGNTCLSIAMLDIDHFKSVNDRYGHDVGDKVIIRVARNISSILRSTDAVGRFGGEEFVIVLPGAPCEPATHVAERIRQAIANVHPSPTSPARVTVSIGLATMAPGQSIADLLRQADSALYVAKNAGRNRLQIAA